MCSPSLPLRRALEKVTGASWPGKTPEQEKGIRRKMLEGISWSETALALTTLALLLEGDSVQVRS